MLKLWPQQSGHLTQIIRHDCRKKISCRNLTRGLHLDSRSRLSASWIPSSKGNNPDPRKDDSQVLLEKLGFLQQAYSGVFHLLPLGLRVQDKLEKLIDRHMRAIGAIRLSLSSISNESLWRESGRLTGSSSAELLHLKSRAGEGYLLSPTHEEEITRLIGNSIKSSKDLPLRLFQISRKYRDERRPRQGLLRTREFLMKDLYTFDSNETKALETYRIVKQAYCDFFKELRLPFIEAEADSGAMGGNYSHEFHYPTPIGEDNVISCKSCDYVVNEELAQSLASSPASGSGSTSLSCSIALAEGGTTLILAMHPDSALDNLTTKFGTSSKYNNHALRKTIPSLIASSEDPLRDWQTTLKSNKTKADAKPIKVLTIFCGVPVNGSVVQDHSTLIKSLAEGFDSPLHESRAVPDLNIQPITDGSICPRCKKPDLQVQTAVELGHTFHLGPRYTKPLNAMISDPKNPSTKIPLSMGCHGIGISRMIGAVASILKDDKGLNWPRAMAPYEVVVIPVDGVDDADSVYDTLLAPPDPSKACEDPPLDVVIDDRNASVPSKLKDADLIGYPVIVLLGRSYKDERKVEVQCRRLGETRHVLHLEEYQHNLRIVVRDLLKKL